MRKHVLFILLTFFLLAIAGCSPQETAMVDLGDGLKYEDLVVGDGKTISEGDAALMHYTLWLEDGTRLQSSKDGEGTPFAAQIVSGRLIEGWIRGVPGMKEGGTRKLYVPYMMAYGEAGRPGSIPERANLIFEMELLEIQ